MTGLRIAVDGRSLVGGSPRGVGHYLAALLRAWPSVAPEDELRVVLPRGPVNARDVFAPIGVPPAGGGDRTRPESVAAGAGGRREDATGRDGHGPRPVRGDAAGRDGHGPRHGRGDAAGRDGHGPRPVRGDAARRDGHRPGVRPVPLPLPGRIVFPVAATVGRPRLDRLAGGCDVAWVVAPAPVAVGDVPYVLTVHDRSWEVRPQDFTAYERAWHVAARPRTLAHRAARVLTTTRVGADDLVAAWDLDAARVRAVPLAPAIGARTVGTTPTVVPTDLAGRFRLFVGALEPRKGPDVLAAALRRLPDPGRTVVVGGGRLDDLLRAPGVERADAVGDEALAVLYAAAEVLVVPSRLEGFGLPAVEALAHGTPVIASDLPEVREVLGDRATYVPPGDPAALAAALAAPPALRPTPLVGRTWTDVARETRAVLAEAAG